MKPVCLQKMTTIDYHIMTQSSTKQKASCRIPGTKTVTQLSRTLLALTKPTKL